MARERRIYSDKGIGERVVDNPMRTDGTLEADLEVKPVGEAGRIVVQVSLSTRIGGFARVRGRTEEQERAAERFRSAWEGAQIGAARAIDYTAVRVDVSGYDGTDTLEHGERARREYRRAVQALGMDRSALVEQVVVHDMSLREAGRRRGIHGGKGRRRLQQRLVESIDILADVFGLVGKGRDRGHLRRDGDVVLLEPATRQG